MLRFVGTAEGGIATGPLVVVQAGDLGMGPWGRNDDIFNRLA